MKYEKRILELLNKGFEEGIEKVSFDWLLNELKIYSIHERNNLKDEFLILEHRGLVSTNRIIECYDCQNQQGVWTEENKGSQIMCNRCGTINVVNSSKFEYPLYISLIKDSI